MYHKNSVSVKVGGKTITLSGNESPEYIANVANYIEDKSNEIRSNDTAKALNPSLISILTSINIADELFKEKETTEKLLKEISVLKNSGGNNENASIVEEINDKDLKIEHLNKEILKLEENIENKNQLIEEIKAEKTLIENDRDKIKEEFEIVEEELKKQVAKFNRLKTNTDKMKKTEPITIVTLKDDNEEVGEIGEIVRKVDDGRPISTLGNKNYYKK